jgi:hypothetical protein
MTWFNWSAPALVVGHHNQRVAYIWLWNLFNRVSDQGHWWGVGLLQINNRHLFYIGDAGVSILFLKALP